MAKNWRAQAACRDMDGELFFPTATVGPAYELQVAEAKAVCATCPVVGACLAEALGRGLVGIWGGTTDDERRQIKRRNARIQARTA
jgi:WhiB family redox-sensing transcriptional regulator